MFSDIIDALLNHGDHYMLLADYEAYIKAQEKVDKLFSNPMEWAKKALLNIAASGKFSSDRTIEQYAKEIWNVEPTLSTLPAPFEGRPGTANEGEVDGMPTKNSNGNSTHLTPAEMKARMLSSMSGTGQGQMGPTY